MTGSGQVESGSGQIAKELRGWSRILDHWPNVAVSLVGEKSPPDKGGREISGSQK